MTAKQAINHDWKEGEAIWKIEYEETFLIRSYIKKPIRVVKTLVKKVDIFNCSYRNEKTATVSLLCPDGTMDFLRVGRFEYEGKLCCYGRVPEYFLSDIMAEREFKRRQANYSKSRESIIKNRIVQYEEQIKDHQNTISFLKRRKKELLKELRKDDS